MSRISARAIEVYDHTYKLVTIDGGFVDPNIPAGFAPFEIRNIDGDLFVTYAKHNAQKHDEVAGQGNDFVEFLTGSRARIVCIRPVQRDDPDWQFRQWQDQRVR